MYVKNNAKNLTLKVEYTSNSNKAGKLFLINNDTEEILFSTDVVLPTDFHKEKTFNLGKLKELKFLNTQKPLEQFKEKIFTDILGKEYFQSLESSGNKDSIKLLRNNNMYEDSNIVQGFNGAFTVSPETFSAINKEFITKNEQVFNLQLSGKRKLWIWGQKNVTRTSSVDYEGFILYGQDALKKEKLREEKSIKTQNEVKKEVKEKIEPTKQPAKIVDQNVYTASQHRNSSYSNNYNDTSMFDVMYMTAFPDLAPFYKPNSAIAWMIYFNQKEHHDNLQYNPVQTINQVHGFQGVKGAEVHINETHEQDYKMQPYKIDLYEDEEKTRFLGTVQYDPEKGLKIKDTDGNKTMITSMEGREGYTAITQGSNGSKSYMEVVPDNSGNLVGNWNINPVNAIAVSSSLKMSEDFSISSNPKTTLDLDALPSFSNIIENTPTTPSNINLGDSPSFESQSKSVYEYKPEPEVENKYENRYEPPPPPPPPPEDDYSYSTSDPYSRSSFSI